MDPLDALHKEKIRRRVAEAVELGRQARRLELGAWHWIRVAGTPWPGRVLAVRDGIAAVGLAELGSVQVVAEDAVGRRLSPVELSDELRREPAFRTWPDADDLVERIAESPRRTGPHNRTPEQGK